MSSVGIMQPYFLPYLGYFSLIEAADEWVFFDTPQYIRKGWVNRNRVLKMGGGVKYISIPVQKAPQETPINRIEIDNGFNWKADIINGLDYYRNVKAPYYKNVIELLESIFSKPTSNLADFIIHANREVLRYLNLVRPILISSQLEFKPNRPLGAGQWAPELAKFLGHNVYFNPPGGRGIFNDIDFRNAGVELNYIQNNLLEYKQHNGGEFVPGLSILDVLMFNNVEQTMALIRSYSVSKS